MANGKVEEVFSVLRQRGVFQIGNPALPKPIQRNINYDRKYVRRKVGRLTGILKNKQQ